MEIHFIKCTSFMQDVSKHIYTSKIKSGKFYGHPNFVTWHLYSYILHKRFFFRFRDLFNKIWKNSSFPYERSLKISELTLNGIYVYQFVGKFSELCQKIICLLLSNLLEYCFQCYEYKNLMKLNSNISFFKSEM